MGAVFAGILVELGSFANFLGVRCIQENPS